VAKKKLYQKPEIRRVKLAPQEAVLTACKTTFGGSAGGAPSLNQRCSELVACTALGS